MTEEMPSQFKLALLSQPCLVARRDHDWLFAFGERHSLAVSVPWRLTNPTAIVLTDADDGQQFGLPEPVDAEQSANAFLRGAVVEGVEIDPVTADLTARFSNGLRLEIFNNSTGHEAWQASFSTASETGSIVALGGGGMAFF